ncbi:hypothetical protein MKX03_014346 [Papaver bracteatum]|nr:hypothetical protein MKX03_014346 [Papaver bracteatum]
MGRAPCCDKANVKKGPWSPEEDLILKQFIEKHGTGSNWISLPHRAGLKRCGKSCRLRWLNYLRPNIKHGEFSDDEDRIICTLYSSIGSRWSIIAAQLPGRTDNDIKNYWNTKLKKKLLISSSTNNSGTSATMLVPSTFPDHRHHHTNINLFSHHHSPYQVSSPSSTYYDQKPILMNSSNHLNNNNNNTTTYSPPNLMSLLSDNQSQHSCSSSDNGSTSNQVSYGTSTTTPAFVGSTHEQNLAYHEGFCNFNITSGVEEDHDEVHKSTSIPTPSGGGVSTLSYDPWNERQNGLWSDHQNHQQLEEIKQLVSSNPNHNSGWNFFMADAQEKFMMYY